MWNLIVSRRICICKLKFIKRQITKPKTCVVLSKELLSVFIDMWPIKTLLLILRSEHLSCAIHVTKSEANKHGD